MQEYLQRRAPHSAPNDLWMFEEENSISNVFRVRVVIKKPKRHQPMEWSEPALTKKLAKQNASWKAYVWLQEHGQLIFSEESSPNLVSPPKKQKIEIEGVKSEPNLSSSLTMVRGNDLSLPVALLPPLLGRLTSSRSRLCYRPYQIDAAEIAIRKNTIINMQTGAGSTTLNASSSSSHILSGKL
jgi:hypothetical protein